MVSIIGLQVESDWTHKQVHLWKKSAQEVGPNGTKNLDVCAHKFIQIARTSSAEFALCLTSIFRQSFNNRTFVCCRRKMQLRGEERNFWPVVPTLTSRALSASQFGAFAAVRWLPAAHTEKFLGFQTAAIALFPLSLFLSIVAAQYTEIYGMLIKTMMPKGQHLERYQWRQKNTFFHSAQCYLWSKPPEMLAKLPSVALLGQFTFTQEENILVSIGGGLACDPGVVALHPSQLFTRKHRTQDSTS